MTATADMREALRQMLAVLELERQALAGLDLDAILGTARDKEALCGTLDETSAIALDEECRAMLDTARRQNEVNRQVRNLVAANVSARLDVITVTPSVYKAGPSYAYAGRRA